MSTSLKQKKPRGSVGGMHSSLLFVDPRETYGRHVIQEMLQSVAPFSSVVDLGAGKGRDLSTAKSICEDSTLHAVECYEENVSLLSSMGFCVHGVDIESHALPFADESIDIVISNQVLEHVKEIFWIINEVSRVLKVGGRFIVGVPNVAALHNRLLLLLGRHPTQSKMCSAHIRCFSKMDFELFLQETWPGGFRCEKFSGSQFYPFPKYISRKLASTFPTLAHTIFFMLQKTKPYDGSIVKYPIVANLETNYRVSPCS